MFEGDINRKTFVDGRESEVLQRFRWTELVATKTNLFLWSFPAFLPAVCGIIAFLALARREVSSRGLSLILVSGLLLAFGFLSERFLAFFLPRDANSRPHVRRSESLPNGPRM